MSVVPIMNRSVPDLGEIHAAASEKDLDMGREEQIEVQQKPDDLPALMKSRLDELPMWRTVWVFRRSVMYVFILTTMNMLEGWQVSHNTWSEVDRVARGIREHSGEQGLPSEIWNHGEGRRISSRSYLE